MPTWWSDLTAHARVLLGLLAAIVLVGGLTVVAAVGDDDTDPVATTGGSTTSSSSTSSSSTVPQVVAVTDPTTGTTLVVTTSTVAPSSTTRATSAPKTTSSTTGATATTRATTTTTKAPASPTCAATSTNSVADELAAKYCSYRAANGLAPMKRTSGLDSMAQQWAQHMADTQTLEHRSDAAVRAGVQGSCPSCTRWAENIAYNATANGSWQAWLASSTHKANIDRNLAGEFGIGAAFANGYWWVVQNFGHYG